MEVEIPPDDILWCGMKAINLLHYMLECSATMTKSLLFYGGKIDMYPHSSQ
ncbi:MAG: hypothetical protein ABH886_01470 [Candidatus Desantisbacteria bacterium]